MRIAVLLVAVPSFAANAQFEPLDIGRVYRNAEEIRQMRAETAAIEQETVRRQQSQPLSVELKEATDQTAERFYRCAGLWSMFVEIGLAAEDVDFVTLASDSRDAAVYLLNRERLARGLAAEPPSFHAEFVESHVAPERRRFRRVLDTSGQAGIEDALTSCSNLAQITAGLASGARNEAISR
jgi:hypothetical protein